MSAPAPLAVPFAHRVELAALRGLTFLVRRIPYPAALALGAGLAWLLLPFARSRHTEACRRIRAVFGRPAGDPWVRGTARRSFRNTAFGMVDILRAPSLSRSWIDRHVKGSEEVVAAVRRACGDGGAVLAIPHMGAWEVAARAVILHGLNVFSIAARQKNAQAEDFINRLRTETGMTIYVRGAGTLRDAIRGLRSGRVMAILPDVRKPTPGIVVPFLGARANVADGMAAMARAANVPILPCHVLREGWTRHRIVVASPVRPDPAADKEADVRRMTIEVFSVIDRVIRDHPEQWFWYNRRWVLDPLPDLEDRRPL